MERSSPRSKAARGHLCSHRTKPGDGASNLSPGYGHGPIYMCESVWDFFRFCFHFVLFFWENKRPLCGTWAGQCSRRENQPGQEEDVASRWNASLLCASLLDLKVSRGLELPKPQACSQEGKEHFTAARKPLQTWCLKILPSLPRGGRPPAPSKDQNSQLTCSAHQHVQGYLEN